MRAFDWTDVLFFTTIAAMLAYAGYAVTSHVLFGNLSLYGAILLWLLAVGVFLFGIKRGFDGAHQIADDDTES